MAMPERDNGAGLAAALEVLADEMSAFAAHHWRSSFPAGVVEDANEIADAAGNLANGIRATSRFGAHFGADIAQELIEFSRRWQQFGARISAYLHDWPGDISPRAR
ncbi:MAG: hypothetical protein KGJ66_04200 [Alphaproteobacteria bacterium]|nr:hypothetical protein [Alphaproteobacteria bacterium]